MNKTKTIKSPLRYPGGKSRAIKILDKYMPEKVNYYYEPFVGGGSVMLHVLQKYEPFESRVNDMRKDLISFYNTCQLEGEDLVEGLRGFTKDMYMDLIPGILKEKQKTRLDTATQYFIGNRCSFLGDHKVSGFSKQASKDRFTESSIDKLEKFCDYLDYDLGYELGLDLLFTSQKFQTYFKNSRASMRFQYDIFMFIDPPYYHNGKSKLYKNHSDFNHTDLKQCIDKIAPHCKFMLTYGDCPEIREMYKGYNITEASWSYGIGKDKTGKELIIRNYE